MYYKPKYFELYEVLPKDFYNINKHKGANLWFIFDHRILWTMDRLREKFGKIVINTWFWGGNCQFRGFRPFDCGIGAELSQHKFGRAIDSFPTNVSVKDIRNDIINKPDDPDYKFISCVETYVPWLHIDCRNYLKGKKGPLIIYP